MKPSGTLQNGYNIKKNPQILKFVNLKFSSV